MLTLRCNRSSRKENCGFGPCNQSSGRFRMSMSRSSTTGCRNSGRRTCLSSCSIPPGSVGPVRARPLGNIGLPQREIREVTRDHPVLFRVSTSRLALTQSCVLDAAGPLQPLWLAGGEPLLTAGTVRGQRIVVMGFSPRQSERLPMTASFPILMGNAHSPVCRGPARAGGDRIRRRADRRVGRLHRQGIALDRDPGR